MFLLNSTPLMEPFVILPKQSHICFLNILPPFNKKPQLMIRCLDFVPSLHIQHGSSILTINLQNNIPHLQPSITCPATFINLLKHTASPHSSLTHHKSKASHAEHLQYFVPRKMWAKYAQLTFETVRVILKSLPPQIRNPHGGGPVKFT